MWKYLQHPNILPLLGATINPPQLISALMSSGDLSEYIEKSPDADRLRLVGVLVRAAIIPRLLCPPAI